MRALLWDIDGTLTRSAGAGTRALMGALHAKPRSADHLRRMRLDGMTDRAIVRLLLAAEHGDASLPVEERARAVPGPLIDEVLAQYLVALERECVSRSLITRLSPPDQAKPSEQQIAALSAACMADSTLDRFAFAAVARSRGDRRITPPAAAAVTVPTLAVVGSLDGARKGLETLKALRPGLKLVIVDGATHAGDRGILGRPELMAALREFLAANRVRTQ